MLSGARKLRNLLKLSKTEADTPWRLIVEEKTTTTLSMDDVADWILPAVCTALCIGIPRTVGQYEAKAISDSKLVIMNISLYCRFKGRSSLICRLKVELMQSEKDKYKKTFIPFPPHCTE